MANIPLNRSAIHQNSIPDDWFAISTPYGIAMVLRCWLPIIFLALACKIWPTPIIWLGAMFMIGVFQYHINILAHSGQHWQLATNRKLNDFLTIWFLQAPLVLPLKRIRRTHLHHHADIGGHDDEDRWYFDIEMTDRLSRAKLNAWFISLFCGGTLLNHGLKLIRRLLGRPNIIPRHVPQAPANKGKPPFTREEVIAVITAQIALFLLFWGLTGHWWAYVPLWAMPRFSIMTGLNGFRATIEHADLGKPAQRLKSFKSNPVERFFLFPFNMNYHGEHHAYMTIPVQNLPKLRQMFLTSEHARDFEIVPSYWTEYKRILKCLKSKTI